MNLKSPAFRISLGLSMSVLSILLFADMVGLIPSQRDVILDTRKTLCESLAVQLSSALATEEFVSVRKSMAAVVDRNEDVLSLRMRTADDEVLAEAGDHSSWQDASEEKSVPNQVLVPLFRGGQRWGAVEVRFGSLSGSGVLGLPAGGIAELALFVVLCSFLLFYYFIRKTLRHLDPSAVIPGRVQSTLDVLAEGVVLMDKNERIVMANSAFSEIASEPSDALIGRRVSELKWSTREPEHDGLPTAESYPWQRALAGGESDKGSVVPLRQESGDTRQFSVNGAPILDPSGAVRGAMATFDDVTEIEQKNDELEQLVRLLESARDEVTRKNRELQTTNELIEAKVTERTKELRASMEQAKAADRAKSAFLANMSHELRTPMHAILSFSQFGMKKIESADKDKLLRYFEHINTSGDSLLALLNNLLDLSKVQANKMEFRLQREWVSVLANHVVAEFGVLAEKHGVTLVHYRPTFGTYIEIDRDRVIQVLRNLISNAIKFTEPGGSIEVGMRNGTIERPGTTLQTVEVWVADSGVGIPEDQLEAIFDPFTQSRLTDSGSGGTGLGLAICREIVEAHGGWIRASNRPEGGALIEFSLPRKHSPPPQ